MAIDPNFKLVPGDVVSVECVVRLVGEGRVWAQPMGHYGDISLVPKDVTLVRQQIVPGDRVTYVGEAGVVRAVEGAEAWVRFESGHRTVGYEHLCRVTPPAEEPEPDDPDAEPAPKLNELGGMQGVIVPAEAA